MKRVTSLLPAALMLVAVSVNGFSQSDVPKEFGVTVGGFTNFPADQDYLSKDISAFYLAPYVRAGRHEFSAGILYPLKAHALYYSDSDVSPRPGAIAGYKYYIFDPEGRENVFIHYAFQYMGFKGIDDPSQIDLPDEHDMYINNLIGLGYSLFFDTKERFGLYYTLDYVISQTGFKASFGGYPLDSFTSWNTRFVWNNLSTHIGFSIKICPIKKKEKK